MTTTSREEAIERWLRKLQEHVVVAPVSTTPVHSSDTQYQSFKDKLFELSASSENISSQLAVKKISPSVHRTPGSPRAFLGDALAKPLLVKSSAHASSDLPSPSNVISRALTPTKRIEFVSSNEPPSPPSPHVDSPRFQRSHSAPRPLSRSSVLSQERFNYLKAERSRSQRKSRVVEEEESRIVQANPQSTKILKQKRENKAIDLAHYFDPNYTGIIDIKSLSSFITDNSINYDLITREEGLFMKDVIKKFLKNEICSENIQTNDLVVFFQHFLANTQVHGFSNSILLDRNSPRFNNTIKERPLEAQTPKPSNSPPFSPRLCSGSEKLVKRLSRPKSPLTRSLELYLDHEERQSRLKSLQDDRVNQQIASCTFSPSIGQTSKELGTIKSRHDDVPRFMTRLASPLIPSSEERELEQCSFSPKTNNCPDFIKDFNDQKKYSLRTTKKFSRSNSPVTPRNYSPSGPKGWGTGTFNSNSNRL
ncbi:hypothetical protein RCL1_007778 [Eukaryota sp. TZLM3-RCL]